MEALAAARWSHLPLPGLAALQDRAQRSAYTHDWGAEGEHIIEVDGQAVGRAWWADTDEKRRVVDVALLPHARGQGIGGATMAEMIRGAGGRRVGCQVDRANARWHAQLLRLGFVEVPEGSDELNVELEHPGGP